MINRYAKQELFIGKSGQQRLNKAHVIIIGAGALGSANAEMLTRAGVGTLTIVDRDYVEWSNLQRQQLYTEEDATNKLPKAIAARNRLRKINSEITIEAQILDVNTSNVESLIKKATLIIDATDNFETRLLVNDAAVKHKIPFIFGACVGSYGLQFSVIPDETPCLHCLIDHTTNQLMTCDTVGVISPIVQMVASHQVTQTLQLISGFHTEAVLHSFDIWKGQKSSINIAILKNENCLTCGSERSYPFLSLHFPTKTDVLCGRDAVQIRPISTHSIKLLHTYERAQNIVTNVIINSYLFSCTLDSHRIVLFKDGRAIVHGTSNVTKARSLYNKLMNDHTV